MVIAWAATAWAGTGRVNCPLAIGATDFVIDSPAATDSAASDPAAIATGMSVARIGKIVVMTFATTGKIIATTCATIGKIGTTITILGTAVGIGDPRRATGGHGTTCGTITRWRLLLD